MEDNLISERIKELLEPKVLKFLKNKNETGCQSLILRMLET
jgi:hypothetical protein